MPGGKLWMIENTSIVVADSYCYADRENNRRLYGRLYTWESAQRACLAGEGWRLSTNGDWRELAQHFGGVFDDARDGGNAAYRALLRNGRSGFDAVLGGGRGSTALYRQIEGDKRVALSVSCIRDEQRV